MLAVRQNNRVSMLASVSIRFPAAALFYVSGGERKRVAVFEGLIGLLTAATVTVEGTWI